MMKRSRSAVVGSWLGATVLVLTACGGGDSAAPTTSAPAAATPTTAPPAPSTGAPVTEAPTTTVALTEAFDAAMAEAIRTGMSLAEIRLACFETNDLSCFTSAEADLVTAETALLEALAIVGPEATAAGAERDACEYRIETVSEDISLERVRILERATAEGLGTQRFGEPDWTYAGERAFSDLFPPGHAVARTLLDCHDAVYSAASGDTMARTLSDFVWYSEWARAQFQYNLWTQYLCVDEDPMCFATLGETDDLGEARVRLEDAYAAVGADPGAAAVSDACRGAIDESMARLMSSLEIHLDVADRPLVSTDPELGSLLARGVYQIDDRRRSDTAPMYPFHEVAVLECVAGLAGIAMS